MSGDIHSTNLHYKMEVAHIVDGDFVYENKLYYTCPDKGNQTIAQDLSEPHTYIEIIGEGERQQHNNVPDEVHQIPHAGDPGQTGYVEPKQILPAAGDSDLAEQGDVYAEMAMPEEGGNSNEVDGNYETLADVHLPSNATRRCKWLVILLWTVVGLLLATIVISVTLVFKRGKILT